jgi:hypothetical protein
MSLLVSPRKTATFDSKHSIVLSIFNGTTLQIDTSWYELSVLLQV